MQVQCWSASLHSYTVSTRRPMPVCRTDCWQLQDCLAKAASKEWYEACGGLLGLRRLMIHHSNVLESHL